MSQIYTPTRLTIPQMTKQAAWGIVEPISQLGTDVKGIEIGVQYGSNSLMLIEACPNISKIVGIDPYLSYQDWDKMVPQSDADNNYNGLLDNLPYMKNKFELIKLKSEEAASQLENESYDFLFIDGDHSLKAVLNDLNNYAPKIKKNGIIAGHDIGLQGVNIAVRSWARRNGVNLQDIRLVENTAWYWIKE